jgi:sugar phosphate permease
MVSMFYLAVPVSSFVGSPISASLLQMHGIGGLHGWQWLFLVEGIPAVLLGIICLLVLPDRPSEARFLSEEQRSWLSAKLAEEQKQVRAVQDHRVFAVLFNPKVLWLALVYAGTSAASNGLSIWQPQIIKSFGLTTMQTGLLNSVPFAVACVAMLLWGQYSDRPGKRISSAVLPLALSVLALCVLVVSKTLVVSVILLSLTLIGTFSFKGPFWALSSETLGPKAAAAGLAMINAVGNLGGFFGTYLIGLLRDRTGSFLLALTPILVAEAIGCVVVIAIGQYQKRAAANAKLAVENQS